MPPKAIGKRTYIKKKNKNSELVNEIITNNSDCAIVTNVLEGVPNNPIDIEFNKEEISTPLEDPVVLQLAINPSRINELLCDENICSIIKYNPQLTEPQPYCPENSFISVHDNLDYKPKNDFSQIKLPSEECNINKTKRDENTHHDIKCYWCCHQIIDNEYGMPIRYDACHASFTTFGSFCSLQCAAAYNYSTNMGCNRVWEIHSWIQLLGKKYGYSDPIRPAPSRYLLKMFNGTMEIDEFRAAHLSMVQTHITNIPPFIHINSQMDIINTSFLSKEKDKKKDNTKNKKDTNTETTNTESTNDTNVDIICDTANSNDSANNLNSIHNEAIETQQEVRVEIDKKKRATRNTKSSLEQKMNLILS